MVRRFIFTSLAMALIAQPAFGQTPALSAPDVAQSSATATSSDEDRDSKKAAFALGTVGAGVAIGGASSLSSDAATPALDYSVPTSDSDGGAAGVGGTAGPQGVPVPEPGTLPLMLAGMVGLVGLAVLRRREAEQV